ncbi:hypothetical protein Tco_1506498 [Tanacetum coccineum]
MTTKLPEMDKRGGCPTRAGARDTSTIHHQMMDIEGRGSLKPVDASPTDEEPTKDEEDEHLAPVDPSTIPVVDLVPSAGDTEAFETDELHYT